MYRAMVLQSALQKLQESQTFIFLIDYEFVLPSVTFGLTLWEATELYQSGIQKRADQQQVLCHAVTVRFCLLCCPKAFASL